MNLHEGVTCNSCLKSNFGGKRYKCLICYDYDLCAECYEAGGTSNMHRAQHAVQCILTRADFELYYAGEDLTSVEQCKSYTCPYCKRMGFTGSTLQTHVVTDHADSSIQVVCPVCACIPGDDSTIMTNDLSSHLLIAHRFGLQNLTSLLGDVPWLSTRNPQTFRGAARARSRRSNMQSNNRDDDVDAIADLLYLLPATRRVGAAGTASSSTVSHSLQLQMERRQIDRQELVRLSHSSDTTQAQSVALEEPANGTSTEPAQVQLPQNSQFLLPRLLEELSFEEPTIEQRAERAMFVQQLLLSSLTERNASRRLQSINPSNLFGSRNESLSSAVTQEEQLQNESDSASSNNTV